MPGSLDSILQGIFGRAVGAARNELDRYGRYAAGLVANSRDWLEYARHGRTCGCHLATPRGVALCPEIAIGACYACGGDVCLNHAFVAPGRVMCAGCVEAVKLMSRGTGQVQGKQEKPKTRSDWLKVLGLKGNVSDADIKAKYKKLARELHPDHGKTDADRAKRTKRMADINAAYAALMADSRARESAEQGAA